MSFLTAVSEGILCNYYTTNQFTFWCKINC